MAFDEDVPQLHLGPVHWLVAFCMLCFLGLVIYQQLIVLGWKSRRASCLTRQKMVQDCVALWENEHGNFPIGTIGWAAFTRRDGIIFKSQGFPKAFSGDAISKCRDMKPWCCPEELYQTFDNDPARVPEDNGRDGFGSYAFIQSDERGGIPPLSDYVQSTTPVRTSLCTAWGGKKQMGPDGRPGSRHSDHW